MKSDIQSRPDVELLIEKFYEKVRKDELLSPVFSHVDWAHHTPVIVSFWCMVLLGERDYAGNPFQKHIPLKIDGAHFERWLFHFRETVNELFRGPVAQEAVTRAESIAGMFRYKLGLE